MTDQPIVPASDSNSFPAAAKPRAPASVGRAGPVGESTGRVGAMDTLRGFALFGIFCVNIAFFCGPFGKAMEFVPPAGATVSDQVFFYFVKIFCEARFYILFSTLFGAGLALQYLRLTARGMPERAFVPLYLRRLAALFCFGVVHIILLWYGDILVFYSIAAIVPFLMRRCKPRTLLITAGTMWAVYLTLVVVFTGIGVLFAWLSAPNANQAPSAATAPAGMPPSPPSPPPTSTAPGESANSDATPPPDAAPPATPETSAATPAVPATALATAPTEKKLKNPDAPPVWRALMNLEEMATDPAVQGQPGGPLRHPWWRDAETEAFKQGPYSQAILMRLILYGFSFVIVVFFGFGVTIVAMMLLGMALVKLDFFAPHRAPWHWRLVMIGGLVGLPLGVLQATAAGFMPGSAAMLMIAVLGPIAPPLIMLGYLGAGTLIVNSGALRPVTAALAATGRMAFTNYLCQSIITTFVMYHWGLAKFGEFSHAERGVYVVCIFACQVLFSVLWLKVFNLGPLEYVWRTLTYFRPPRMLRAGAIQEPGG